MVKAQRFLSLLAGAAAALLGTLFLSSALSHAEWPGGGPYETCNDGVCLVMGDADPNDWRYDGIRPFFTQWKAVDGQPYIVQVDQGDGTQIDAGSYDIKVSDTWTPLVASYVYQYGDFVPNADAPAGLDLGWFDDLSGSRVYDTEFFGGAARILTMYDIGPHDVTYVLTKFLGFTNTMITGPHESADYIQFGQSEPIQLWNTLFHPGLDELQVPQYLIPDDPFAGPDFDPGDFVFGGVVDP